MDRAIQGEIQEIPVKELLAQIGGLEGSPGAIPLSQSNLGVHQGLVHTFNSPHEVIAAWGSGARVSIDSAVRLPSDTLDALVADSIRDQGRHVVVCTVSAVDCITGLDGMRREGLDALLYTLSSLLPLANGEEVVLLALPQDSSTLRIFTLACFEGGPHRITEHTLDQHVGAAQELGRSVELMQQLHHSSIQPGQTAQELVDRRDGWERCAQELEERAAASRGRYDRLICAAGASGQTVLEMERSERLLKELEVLAQLARDTAAGQMQRTNELPGEL
ncbi:MAG: hypothetical protein EBZ48_06815, partial [Proteobacteria bacterium]|nr:hypothetical protein [Pseudomonadota bacterium]